jgi:hypothetical protein
MIAIHMRELGRAMTGFSLPHRRRRVTWTSRSSRP